MRTHIVKLRRALVLLVTASLLGISFATVSAPRVVAASCTITGTSRSETLNGTSGPDVICGLGGNDTINGLGGNDIIYGGVGNDRISGGFGDDQLIGDAGADTLNGGVGADTVSYSAASARLSISIDGRANDGATGERDSVALDVENVIGGSGSDKITGSASANDLNGGTGNDTITGGSGDDLIDGGIGNDSLVGGIGNDVINGDIGDDTIRGEIGNDTLDGESGMDQVDGGAGTNTCSWEPRESRASSCVYDMTAPVFSDFSISTERVDITNGDQLVTVSFSVQDDRDGVETSSVYPGGFWYSVSEVVWAESLERVSGDALSASYRATYRFASTIRPTSYSYSGLVVIDGGYNTSRLDWNDLDDRDWQSSIEVVSSRVFEDTPPSLLSVEFSRDQISRSSGDQTLTIDVSVADDGVGIPEGAVGLTFFKDATFTYWYYVEGGVRISGDDAAAIYRFTFTFPPDAQPGRWILGGVWLVDANRNWTYLGEEELRSQGFDWSVELTP